MSVDDVYIKACFDLREHLFFYKAAIRLSLSMLRNA
jgi:hypothetical protein